MKRFFSLLVDVLILVLFAGFVHAAFWVEDPYVSPVLAKADFVGVLCLLAILAKWVFTLDQGLLSLLFWGGGGGRFDRIRSAFFAYPRQHRADLLLMVGSVAFTLVVVELVLRLFIGLLPMELGNVLGTPYRTSGSGIYTWDGDRNMPRLKPNFSRRAFMYGYQWRHQGDYRGYRNPEDWEEADIVLLGDSMIYGHGVEEPATVRAHLAELAPRQTVANLGQQGADIAQEFEIFHHDALPLKPDYAILFYFYNDLSDLMIRLNDEEMNRFLAMDVDDFSKPYFDVKPQPRRRQSVLRPLESVIFESYLVRSISYAVAKLTGEQATVESPAPEKFDKGAAGQADVANWRESPFFEGQPRRQLAMAFHLRMMDRFDELAKANGIEIILPVIATADPVVTALLREKSEALGWGFVDLQPLYEEAEASGAEVFLLGDGHYTDAGARLTAETLIATFPRLSEE